jgi:hypothetical protein
VAKQKESPSLADELCAYEKRPRRRWFEALPSEVRSELEKVRQRMRSGQCKKPYLSMAKDIKSKLSLPIQPLAITQWLKSPD